MTQAGTGVHATAICYGESGVMIVGPSGSGKSALALAALARARDRGLFGALVGDDRVYLRAQGGRLVASGALHMAGVIERRGTGLVRIEHEPACVVRLIVELSGRGQSWPRLPEGPDGLTFEGISLPRLALDSSGSPTDNALALDDCMTKMAADDCGRKGISLEQSAAVHKNGKVAVSPRA